MPEAFAAVTEPSFAKAGRRPDTESIVTPSRIYSSLSKTISLLRVLIVTGVISSWNLPALLAASALFWLATAKASWSSRLIWYFSARFSAVRPI